MRGEVKVNDIDRRVIEGDLDTIYFKDIVGEVGEVKVGVGEGVVD